MVNYFLRVINMRSAAIMIGTVTIVAFTLGLDIAKTITNSGFITVLKTRTLRR